MQEIYFLGDGEPEKRVSTSVMLDFCIALQTLTLVSMDYFNRENEGGIHLSCQERCIKSLLCVRIEQGM